MTKVMVFGTFNTIHPGHLSLFRQARHYGDRLFVVIAKDQTVNKIKKYKPRNERERMKKLSKIPQVDKVILGDNSNYFKCINDNKPDVICVGYDQRFQVDKLDEYIHDNQLDIQVVRLKPYKQHKYKSSKMENRD